MMKYRYYLLIGIGILFTSCESVQLEKVEAARLQGITFEDSIVAILDNSCSYSGCHDGTIPPDLTASKAYNALKLGGLIDADFSAAATTEDSLEIAKETKLFNLIKVDANNPMPPTSAGKDKFLTTHDRDMILSWILDEHADK